MKGRCKAELRPTANWATVPTDPTKKAKKRLFEKVIAKRNQHGTKHKKNANEKQTILTQETFLNWCSKWAEKKVPAVTFFLIYRRYLRLDYRFPKRRLTQKAKKHLQFALNNNNRDNKYNNINRALNNSNNNNIINGSNNNNRNNSYCSRCFSLMWKGKKVGWRRCQALIRQRPIPRIDNFRR